MVDTAVSGAALLWHWSGHANEITWTIPASQEAIADASQLCKGDAQIRLHDGTIATLSELALSAARDSSAFVGHIAASPPFLAIDGAAVFGRWISPLDVAGAVFPDELACDGQSDALSRALIEGMEALPEAFVLYDAEDRMLICNAQYKRLYPAVADLMKPGLYFPDLVRESVRRGVFKISDDEDNWVERRISFHRTDDDRAGATSRRTSAGLRQRAGALVRPDGGNRDRGGPGYIPCAAKRRLPGSSLGASRHRPTPRTVSQTRPRGEIPIARPRDAASSPGGFRTPALSPVRTRPHGPASETLHISGSCDATRKQTLD